MAPAWSAAALRSGGMEQNRVRRGSNAPVHVQIGPRLGGRAG